VKGLTAKQAEVLAYLNETILETGRAPSIREIRNRFGFALTNAAADHLWALDRKGFIESPAGKHRAIRVLRLPESQAQTVPARLLGAPVTVAHPEGGTALFWQVSASDPPDETTCAA